MKKFFGIFDQDILYTERLASIIKAENDFPFEICTYSSIDKLITDLKSNLIFSCLISESVYTSIQEADELLLESTKIVLLCSNSLFDTVSDKDISKILKYQSGIKIKKDLLKCLSSPEYTNLDSEINYKIKSTKLIGVYSPCESHKNSALSLAISKILSKENKILLIPLEPFFPFKNFSNQGNDITDLLYTINQNTGNTICKIESLVSIVDNLSFIPPAFSYNDLLTIKEEDWYSLLDILINSGIYDYIILSLNEIISGLFQILKKCSHIYSGYEINDEGNEIISNYSALIKTLEYDDILNKTTFFNILDGLDTSKIYNKLFTSLCSYCE